jgi:hypothetical protein
MTSLTVSFYVEGYLTSALGSTMSCGSYTRTR